MVKKKSQNNKHKTGVNKIKIFFILVIVLLIGAIIALTILIKKEDNSQSKPSVNKQEAESYEYYDNISNDNINDLHFKLQTYNNYRKYLELFSDYDKFMYYKIKNLYNNNEFDYVISVLNYIFIRKNDEKNAYDCKTESGNEVCKYFVDLIPYVTK